MSARHFYIRIAVYIILLVVLSGSGVWLFLANKNLIFLIPIILGILIFSFQVLHSFDKIQGKITYFFNAVENEDATLYYPEKIANKPLRELHKSLNRVNSLIREAKLKNREQEQYFAALLEQVATGIVVINPNGNILQANSAAKKLLNYKTLTHIVQLKRVDENLYKAFTMLTKGHRQLIKLTHNDTTTQLTLQASNFNAQDENFSLVSIQDIRNELDAKEIESWQKLIRVLTHEIMNSITPITSLSDTLLGYYKETTTSPSSQTVKNTVKGLEVIRERGDGLIRFVASYRKLTKISPPVIETITVKPFIEHIVLLFTSETTNTPICFEQETIPETLTLNADEGQISQILINLIKNAIEAIESVENPTIKIIAKQNQNDCLQISVSDNGIGIQEELIEQIFIPFFTTKENGSGIGLSLSRQIMRNHRGNIKVISKQGKGSMFVLEFEQ